MQFLLWQRDLDRIFSECAIYCQHNIAFYADCICYVLYPKGKLHVDATGVELPDDYVGSWEHKNSVILRRQLF